MRYHVAASKTPTGGLIPQASHWPLRGFACVLLRGFMSALDLSGRRFGRLLVSHLGVQSSDGRRRWVCRCDCGGESLCHVSSLTSGNTKSCGCLQRERASKSSLVDISGSVFGRLTAVSLDSMSKKGAMWRCICSCGKEKVARIDSLTTGNTMSCGCLWSEKIAESNRADIAGRVFGKLTAIRPMQSVAHAVRWRCRCSCGGEKAVLAAKLISGSVISCGCAKYDQEVYMPERARLKSAEHGSRRRARKLSIGGAFTADQILDLYKKQRGRCACCGQKLEAGYHKDHRKALFLGGSNDILNIELLCPSCNLAKGARDEIAWANMNGKLC